MWSRVQDLKENDETVAVGDDADVSNLRLRPRKVVYTTRGPEADDFFEIHTLDSPRPLALTQHHALLLHTGKVTTAAKLKIGDTLVRADGSPAPVVDIVRLPADDDVFNFLVESQTLAGHLVVAEGVVAGDLLWQNVTDADVAAVSLR